jgi:hypothetical protein
VLKERPYFYVSIGRGDFSPFSAGFEQQDFIKTYPFVTQQVGRVGADENLTASARLYSGKHLGQVSDYFWM